MGDLHQNGPLLLESLPQVVDDLRQLGRERTLEPGEIVWQGGEPAEDVAVVLEGGLEVLCEGADGEDAVFRRVHPGGVVAQVPADMVTQAPGDEPRPTLPTLRARVASRLSLVARPRFRSFLKQHPDLLEQLLWLQIERVHSIPVGIRRECAARDPLTGLYTGRFFGERLAIELERARLMGDTLVVALFDVDHLRRQQEAHGREASEGILRRLGELLRKTGRRGDVAARLGDDELAMLLYGANASDGWRFAESFRGVVMATSLLPDSDRPPRRVTISGGIASYPQDGEDEVALTAAARARIAQAKQAGGNGTVGVTLRTR